MAISKPQESYLSHLHSKYFTKKNNKTFNEQLKEYIIHSNKYLWRKLKGPKSVKEFDHTSTVWLSNNLRHLPPYFVLRNSECPDFDGIFNNYTQSIAVGNGKTMEIHYIPGSWSIYNKSLNEQLMQIFDTEIQTKNEIITIIGTSNKTSNKNIMRIFISNHVSVNYINEIDYVVDSMTFICIYPNMFI